MFRSTRSIRKWSWSVPYPADLDRISNCWKNSSAVEFPWRSFANLSCAVFFLLGSAKADWSSFSKFSQVPQAIGSYSKALSMKLWAHASAAPLRINERAKIILSSSVSKSLLLAMVYNLTERQNRSRSWPSHSSGLAT